MEYARLSSRHSPWRVGTPLRVALAVSTMVLACVVVSAAAPGTVRAFRVPATSLSSPAAIRRALASAQSDNFDVVIVPVPVAPREDAQWDGVAEWLRVARENGLTAHLSIDVTVAADAGELPASRGHVIYQHPEWLMVPRELAPELLKIDARSPAYLGQLARWARAHADRVAGLSVSPLDPAAATYLVGAVTSVMQKYAVDGVYLDGIEFPGRDFDYSRHTMDIFRAHMRSSLSSAERSALDAIEAIDPFAYAEEFPDDWSRFRESALTGLLERVRSALRSAHPQLSLAAGIDVDAETSLRDHFQDWRSWLDRGLVDRVGYRGALDTSVLLSADGIVPADTPARLSSAQAGAGESR